MSLIHHLIDFLHTVQLKISKRYSSTQNLRKKTGPDKSASFEFHTVTSAESIDYQVKHKFKAEVLQYCLREGC